jgi:protein-tyrosine phosphatase
MLSPVAVSVLFVCTGNICRSPMAERLLRARLAGPAASLIEAGSAGMQAMAGYAMDEVCARVLSELGGASDGHVARQLDQRLVESSDLVLAAITDQRGQIVRATPTAMRRVFTLREFARLGTGLGPLRRELSEIALRGRIEEVADQRGLAEPAAPGADDIGDPFGSPLPVVRECGAQISAAVHGIIAALGL